jgi:hypothetical protein
VAKRFAVAERKQVLEAALSLTGNGLCRRFSDGRFALSISGKDVLS